MYTRRKRNNPMSIKYILCAIYIFPKIELHAQMASSVYYFKHLRKKEHNIILILPQNRTEETFLISFYMAHRIS